MSSPINLTHQRTKLADIPGYKWLLMSLLFLVACVNYADRTAFTAIFPLLKKDLGLSDIGLAAVGTVFLWSYALASPFAGYLGDRLSRRSLVIWSLLAWSLVTVFSGFAFSVSQLLIMRVLLGLFESLYIPSALGLIAEHHTAQTRATAMGVHLAGINLGTVAGGSFSGYIADLYGWRSAVISLGGIGLILAMVCYFLLFDEQAHGNSSRVQSQASKPSMPFWEAVESLKIPSYLIVASEAMFISIGTWVFTNWLPLYFKESFDLSLGEAGFAGTFTITLGVVIGLLGGGYLSDRVAKYGARQRMLAQSLFYLSSTPFLLCFLWSDQLEVIAVCIFTFSLIRAMGQANESPLLCDILTPKNWSTAFGLMNMANCFAGGAGILLAGYLKSDFGLKAVFATISVAVLLASTLLLLGYLTCLKNDLKRRSEVLPAL